MNGGRGPARRAPRRTGRVTARENADRPRFTAKVATLRTYCRNLRALPWIGTFTVVRHTASRHNRDNERQRQHHRTQHVSRAIPARPPIRRSHPTYCPDQPPPRCSRPPCLIARAVRAVHVPRHAMAPSGGPKPAEKGASAVAPPCLHPAGGGRCPRRRSPRLLWTVSQRSPRRSPRPPQRAQVRAGRVLT